MRKASTRKVTARKVPARKPSPVKSPTKETDLKDVSPRKLLTLDEAGAIVGRSVDALRQLIFRKKFPFTKISGRLGVDAEELERFLKLSRQVTAEEAVERIHA